MYKAQSRDSGVLTVQLPTEVGDTFLTRCLTLLQQYWVTRLKLLSFCFDSRDCGFPSILLLSPPEDGWLRIVAH